MNPAPVYRAAALYLEENGMCSGILHDDSTTKVCVLGAIALAEGTPRHLLLHHGKEREDYIYDILNGMQSIKLFADYLVEPIGAKRQESATKTIWRYVDDRNAGYVVKLLNSAAEHYEGV